MDSPCYSRMWENDPEGMARLREDDPKHDAMRREGWSWLQCVGGPYDGMYNYFVGSPVWEMHMVDPSVDPNRYEPGDLEHKYVVAEGPDGEAVYQHRGEFRRERK